MHSISIFAPKGRSLTAKADLAGGSDAKNWPTENRSEEEVGSQPTFGVRGIARGKHERKRKLTVHAVGCLEVTDVRKQDGRLHDRAEVASARLENRAHVLQSLSIRAQTHTRRQPLVGRSTHFGCQSGAVSSAGCHRTGASKTMVAYLFGLTLDVVAAKIHRLPLGMRAQRRVRAGHATVRQGGGGLDWQEDATERIGSPQGRAECLRID